MEMGFQRHLVEEALNFTDGDKHEATNYLISRK
jgi:hypothetical protein